MSFYRALPLASIVLALMSSGFATAQEDASEDVAKLDLKTFSCAQYLELVRENDGRSEVVAVWGHGYHTAHRDVDMKTEPITWRKVAVFAELIGKACRLSPKKLWIDALRQIE